MKKRILLGIGISVGLLLITEASAAGPVRGPGKPAPTHDAEKKATVDDNAAIPGADIDWALQEVIGQVATAADEVGENDPAYTVSVIDVRNARLQIYRKSSAADNFDLQRYRALAPAGVSIVFESAALSAKEIENLYRLISTMEPAFQAAGIRLHSWGPDYASGMRIHYTAKTPGIPPSLLEKLEIYGPGTVAFKVGSVESLTSFAGADRQADTSPFAGGARVHGPNRDGGTSPAQCTSNFAAKSTGNGQYYAMTAWHCYKPTDKRFWAIAGGSATNYIGSVSSTDAAKDVAFIPVANGQKTVPLVYDGDHNNPQQLKLVNGSASPQVGNLVCNSGATLSVVCDVRISGTQKWKAENYYTGAISPEIYGFRAAKENGGPAAAKGDSGGPVFRLNSNDQYATALGLMSNADVTEWMPCPWWVTAGTQCTRVVYLTDIAATARAHSLVLSNFS
jgi:hypothetical protein